MPYGCRPRPVVCRIGASHPQNLFCPLTSLAVAALEAVALVTILSLYNYINHSNISQAAVPALVSSKRSNLIPST